MTALTDSSGAVVERYRYDAYGKPEFLAPDFTSLSSSAVGNRILFTGAYHDAESGNYHLWHREYDPYLGRFLQRDPLGEGASLNLYAYVGDNPVNATDPTGLMSEDSRYRVVQGSARGSRNIFVMAGLVGQARTSRPGEPQPVKSDGDQSEFCGAPDFHVASAVDREGGTGAVLNTLSQDDREPDIRVGASGLDNPLPTYLVSLELSSGLIDGRGQDGSSRLPSLENPLLYGQATVVRVGARFPKPEEAAYTVTVSGGPGGGEHAPLGAASGAVEEFVIANAGMWTVAAGGAFVPEICSTYTLLETNILVSTNPQTVYLIGDTAFSTVRGFSDGVDWIVGPPPVYSAMSNLGYSIGWLGGASLTALEMQK